MIARLSYARLPRPLVDELAAAGLDPVEVYGHVVAAFEEDLPGGADDVTSAAMPEMGRAVADVVSRETGVVAGLAVAEVALRLVGSPTDLELYVVDEPPTGVPSEQGLSPAATVSAAAEEEVVLDEPASGRYLVVWITSLPSVSDGFRSEVAEVVPRG